MINDGRTAPPATVLVNGQRREVRTEPDTALLYVLRNHLGLKGTRFGCGVGLCGACMVMIDGRTAYSCDTPLWAVVDKEITTVEGLGAADWPHPVTEALIAGQAAQCGYCMSGVTIAAVELLRQNDRSLRRGGPRRPRPQPVPVWRAQPHRPRHTRGRGRTAGASEGCGMNPATRVVALPPSVAENPRLGDWLRVLPSGVVEIRPGKVELGQGVLTACPRWPPRNSTSASPGCAGTSGHRRKSRRGLHRRQLVHPAFRRRDPPRMRGGQGALSCRRRSWPRRAREQADRGRRPVLAPDGRSTSYWELADDALLDRAASGDISPRPLPPTTSSARACPGLTCLTS